MRFDAALIPGAEWLPFLAVLAAKVTVILLLTAAVAALLWRSSAAVRHMVWCVGLAGVLALPVLSAVVPAWKVPLLPASQARAAFERGGVGAGEPAPEAGTAAAMPVRSAPAAVMRAPDGVWLGAVPALVLAGSASGLLWLGLGLWGVARLGRRSEVVRDPEWLRTAHEAAEKLGLRRPVLLLRSGGAPMPATWGLLWPSVLLPFQAGQWADDRRQAVLAHELAHVKRFDCLTQALAQVVCAVFWWHPAVWYAARRLRVERERACDDLVLGTGARACDYAAHLLEIASTYRGPRFAALALVSMAKPSQLESRLLSVLDGARARRAPSARMGVLSMSAALLVVGPLAAMKPAERVAAAASPSAAAHPFEASPSEPGARAAGPARADGAVPSHTGALPDTVPSVAERVAYRSLGVDAAYLAELRGAGLTGLTANQVIALKAAGVTAEYVAEMQGGRFGRLTPEQLALLGGVNVTWAYVDELGRHGYPDLSAEEAAVLKAVGVTGEYVTQMAAVGYRPSADALAGMRGVGVSAAYVQGLAEVGLTELSAEELTSLRARGVTAAWVRELAAAGLVFRTPEELIQLRTSGPARDPSEDRSRTGSAAP